MNHFKFSLAAITSAMLVACGGGGGSTTSALPAGPATPSTTPASSVVTTPVLAMPYSPTLQAEELAAYNLLNAERINCGLGTLTQNNQLDSAAKAHAEWLLGNNYVGHGEVANTPGFTGANPMDRAVAAGYMTTGQAGGVSEVVTSRQGVSSKASFGVTGLRNLLNAPYHSLGLLGASRDVGIAVRDAVDTASTFGPRVAFTSSLGYRAPEGVQDIAASAVVTYPCAGSTGISRQLLNESPNPVPGRDLATSPLGSSIMMVVREGQTLTVASASMTAVSTGLPVTLRTPVTSANDPNASLGTHKAYVAADAPLQANSAYDVVINGANNGTAFTRSFRFTTGL